MSLSELAERCEQAKGPDRELDCLIHCAVNGWAVVYEGMNVFADMGPTMRRMLVGWLDPGKEQRNFSMTSDSLAPLYTASLDAALAMVPICPMTGGNRWAVQLDSGFYGATVELWHECSLDKHHGHAGGQHEAMCRALCAAALRALAASADRNPQGEKPQALSAEHESAVTNEVRQTPVTSPSSPSIELDQ